MKKSSISTSGARSTATEPCVGRLGKGNALRSNHAPSTASSVLRTGDALFLTGILSVDVDHPPLREDRIMSYSYDEGDWGGWDTDTADDQGNLPGQ